MFPTRYFPVREFAPRYYPHFGSGAAPPPPDETPPDYGGTPVPRACFSFNQKERLIYIRPDGLKYPLHAPPVRVVMQEEGFGTPPLAYVTDKAPFQHGDNVRSFTLQPRPVQLVVLQNFRSRADYRDGRAAFLDVLRPNRITNLTNPGKLLAYLATGEKRQLDVFLDSGPGFTPSQGGWREWSFTEAIRFTAHDPTWYDPAQKSETFTGSATATFPMTFPVVFATFGWASNVAYLGTWEEYPSFNITGPITGLRIQNLTTGDQIVLETEIPSGMAVSIALRGRKTIMRSDGVNLLNTLSSDSDLTTFSLAPDPVASNGVNSIQVSGSGTSGPSSVTMYWYNRYFGI